jgi:hypothetical protein
VDKILEEHKSIVASPNGVPFHCQVNHSIDLPHGVPLPNGLVYRSSIMENEEIKHQIQDLILKGHIKTNLLTLWEPNYSCI